MRLWQQLARTEAIALVALFVAASLMAAYGAIDAIRSPGMFSPAGSAQIGFFGTLIFGVAPVTLFGAPAYVYLSRRGLATWRLVALVALAPVAMLLFVDVGLAIIALLCGSTVAGLTHLVCSRWAGPNNSSKPTPLRGAA